jgi:hypothetical protein
LALVESYTFDQVTDQQIVNRQTLKLKRSRLSRNEPWADKIRWFAALTFEERVAWLDEWTEIILQNNPDVLERFNDDSAFEGNE